MNQSHIYKMFSNNMLIPLIMNITQFMTCMKKKQAETKWLIVFRVIKDICKNQLIEDKVYIYLKKDKFVKKF